MTNEERRDGRTQRQRRGLISARGIAPGIETDADRGCRPASVWIPRSRPEPVEGFARDDVYWVV